MTDRGVNHVTGPLAMSVHDRHADPGAIGAIETAQVFQKAYLGVALADGK